MTSGILGIMACPMLEDELVYSLSNDREEKDIFLLDNDHNKMIIPKLEENGVPYTLLNERSFLSGEAEIPGDGYRIVIWMMDLGLHEEPENLRIRIRELMSDFQEHVDAIALYYGLCGNGLKGIEEWSSSNLAVPMTICKDRFGKVCDDCICVPMGGTDNYLRLLKKYPGIMYFTPGMACSFEEFMDSMELFRGVEKGDREMFKMVLEMADYKYVMKIQTGLGDQRNFQRCVEEFAEKYELEVMELEDGWVSTEVADLTYEHAKSLLNGHMERAA